MIFRSAQRIVACMLVAVSAIASSSAVMAASENIDLFGRKAFIDAKDPAMVAQIKQRLTDLKPMLQGTFDPDCYYKNSGNKGCGQNINKTELKKIEAMVKELRTETQGIFEPKVKRDGKTRRDFGGLQQGYVLDMMAREFKGAWTLNLAGDIFISDPTATDKSYYLADPKADLPFAQLKMNSGWIIGSSSPALGGTKRDPRTGETIKTWDFIRIYLFAKPEFNGARLDAWAVASIVGGKKLLDDLWKLKKYEGQWAYLHFDKDKVPTCSPNLKCDFADANKRVVQVGW